MASTDFDTYAFKIYKLLGVGWIVVVLILVYLFFKKDERA